MIKLPIETKHLYLRNFSQADWERVHLYGTIPEFSQYELWGPNSVEDTKAFISRMVAQVSQSPRYQFDLAVCLNDSSLLIGSCTIQLAAQESYVAHLGWAINPDYQRKGYATEAAQALIRCGFQELGLVVIYATCDTRNLPSIRVMEKLGMKRTGFIKGDKEFKDHIRDTVRYEILRQ
ncbi:MAG: GNAT family N-acetyltransferase [Deltaproteobacteria bacterium]|nr:GNAT family N-acetyltransferase [Deltaproteobacteria bacterium]